jgi:hypothetical protein
VIVFLPHGKLEREVFDYVPCYRSPTATRCAMAFAQWAEEKVNMPVRNFAPHLLGAEMMRYAKTLRCCCCNVDTAVIMLSTNREPAALCVPKLPLRAYSVNSVALFVRVPDTASLRHNSDLPTIGVLCQLVVD